MRTQADHADVAASAAEISATVTAQDAAADAGTGAVRRPGRPRSERAEQAIIDATIEALGERGIDGVHCEDVAARAGVGVGEAAYATISPALLADCYPAARRGRGRT